MCETKINECPECGCAVCVVPYDQPPAIEFVDVLPGWVFRCPGCNLRLDAWNYVRPYSAEKAVRQWNHHSSIWPTEAARARRQLLVRSRNKDKQNG